MHSLFVGLSTLYISGIFVFIGYVLYNINDFVDFMHKKIEIGLTETDKRLNNHFNELTEKYGEDYAYKKFLQSLTVVVLFVAVIWPYFLYIDLLKKDK